MQFDISGNPDYGDLSVILESGDTVLSEAGAMSRMSTNLEVKGRLVGGMVGALARKFLGGESLFLAEYAATQPGFVCLAPTHPGCVLHRKLTGDSFMLTRGSFLACTPDVTLQTRFGGLKSFLSGEGAFFIQTGGQGDLFYCAYGGVVEKQVEGAFTVDTGHVVAWEPTLEYAIRGMGGLKQTLFSGEGLVMEFTGQGKLYLQTRHMAGFAGWLTPFLRG